MQRLILSFENQAALTTDTYSHSHFHTYTHVHGGAITMPKSSAYRSAGKEEQEEQPHERGGLNEGVVLCTGMCVCLGMSVRFMWVYIRFGANLKYADI